MLVAKNMNVVKLPIMVSSMIVTPITCRSRNQPYLDSVSSGWPRMMQNRRSVTRGSASISATWVDQITAMPAAAIRGYTQTPITDVKMPNSSVAKPPADVGTSRPVSKSTAVPIVTKHSASTSDKP